MLPQLLLQFSLELSEPQKTLKTYDWWFNKQTGLVVTVSRRRALKTDGSLQMLS